MAKFQKGYDARRGKGGKREGAGRPTKEQVEERKTGAEIAKAKIEAKAKELAERFLARALARKADKVLMHAIDKLVPQAKTTVVVEGGGELEEVLRRIEEKKRK